MSDAPIRTHVNDRAWAVLEKARLYCEKLLSDARMVCDSFLTSRGVKAEEVCCVVVGSVGRQEALGASDLDLIPVLGSAAALTSFLAHDKPLRQELRDKLKVKVSQGMT